MKKLFLLAAAAVMAACATNREYMNALPVDAVTVVGIEPSVLEGVDMASLIDEPAWKAIAEDLARSGLSLKEKVYLFVLEDEEYGVVAGVKEPEKVASLGLENAAHNDNAFVWFSGDKEYAQKLLGQSEGESFMKASFASGVLESESDFCAVADHGALMKMAALGRGLTFAIPQQEYLENARYTVEGNFEKGKIVADMRLVFSDKKSEKAHADHTKGMIGKVDGVFAKFVPKDAMLVAAANIHGSKMAEEIKGSGYMDAMIEQVKPALEAIEGDVLIVVTEYDKERDVPRLAIFAQLSKPQVIADYAAMAESMGAESVGEKRYIYDFWGHEIHFGVIDDMFYATNEPRIAEALDGKNIASMNKGEMSGYGFLSLDAKKTAELIDALPFDMGQELKPLTGEISTVKSTSLDPVHTRIELTLADENANPAEVIVRVSGMLK